jgi:acetyl-CoA carboxylase carboxyltransferase component
MPRAAVQVRGSSHMFLTGPDVIRQVMREDVTMEALGGADTHASKSGNAHGVFVRPPPCSAGACCPYTSLF